MNKLLPTEVDFLRRSAKSKLEGLRNEDVSILWTNKCGRNCEKNTSGLIRTPYYRMEDQEFNVLGTTMVEKKGTAKRYLKKGVG